MQRLDVTSTSRRRCINVMCPLGSVCIVITCHKVRTIYIYFFFAGLCSVAFLGNSFAFVYILGKCLHIKYILIKHYNPLGESADDKLMIFGCCFCFQENMLWHFMQIVSIGYMSNKNLQCCLWINTKDRKSETRWYYVYIQLYGLRGCNALPHPHSHFHPSFGLKGISK